MEMWKHREMLNRRKMKKMRVHSVCQHPAATTDTPFVSKTRMNERTMQEKQERIGSEKEIFLKCYANHENVNVYVN